VLATVSATSVGDVIGALRAVARRRLFVGFLSGRPLGIDPTRLPELQILPLISQEAWLAPGIWLNHYSRLQGEEEGCHRNRGVSYVSVSSHSRHRETPLLEGTRAVADTYVLN
jgi:hypothetical protein